MKKIAINILMCFMTGLIHSQNTATAKAIDKADWERILTASVQQQAGIEYPIFKVFQFKDSKGVGLVVLTESKEHENTKGEPINSAVTAFMLRGSGSLYDVEWENRHYISKNFQEERSIWFWSKYIECRDIDQDGESETILVFGTSGVNGFDDGRVFVEIYYKGKLISIEHQNAVKDFNRMTNISPEFYSIPKSIQNKVISKMKQMVASKQTIFPANWEQKMAMKKTDIQEQ
jgi:hypothetical protein